jgi:hypothetical protein
MNEADHQRGLSSEDSVEGGALDDSESEETEEPQGREIDEDGADSIARDEP